MEQTKELIAMREIADIWNSAGDYMSVMEQIDSIIYKHNFKDERAELNTICCGQFFECKIDTADKMTAKVYNKETRKEV